MLKYMPGCAHVKFTLIQPSKIPYLITSLSFINLNCYVTVCVCRSSAPVAVQPQSPRAQGFNNTGWANIINKWTIEKGGRIKAKQFPKCRVLIFVFRHIYIYMYIKHCYVKGIQSISIEVYIYIYSIDISFSRTALQTPLGYPRLSLLS